MRTFSWRRLASAALLLSFGIAAQASPTVTVFTANAETGAPRQLVAGPDGLLYVASTNGVFRMYGNGSYAMVAAIPGGASELIAGYDGNFYGVSGATPEAIFRLRPDGSVTRLALFDGTVASYGGGLVYGSDGNLYGSIDTGIFKLTPGGALTRISTYRGYNLAEGLGGNFFGTSTNCDPYVVCYSWTNLIFKMTSAGTVTQTGSFDCSQGDPTSLIATPSGVLYGGIGGIPSFGRICSGPGGIMALDASGNYTRLVTFDQDDGVVAPLLYASDGTLFGVTTGYYDFFGATAPIPPRMFRYRPPAQVSVGAVLPLRGVVTIEGASFDTHSGLVQVSDGTIYGINGGGTIYRLKRPTTLAGHGTFFVDPLTATVKINPTATLTDDMTHRGVPGQTIRFSRKGQTLCVVQTDVTGTATCKIAAKDHTGGFDASFAETDLYAASSVNSPLACIGTVCP